LISEVKHIWIEKAEQRADWRAIGREKTLPRKVSVGAMTVCGAHERAIRKSSVVWTQEDVQDLPEHKLAHIDMASDATPKSYDELMAERLQKIKDDKQKHDDALRTSRENDAAIAKDKIIQAKIDAEARFQEEKDTAERTAAKARLDAASAHKQRLEAAEAHRVAMSEDFHTGNFRGAKQGYQD
jgi:hypothetical protein